MKDCEHVHTTPDTVESWDVYKEERTGMPQPAMYSVIDVCDECGAFYDRHAGEWFNNDGEEL